MKLVLGISGASGIPLALRFLEKLPKEIEVFVVASKNAHVVALEESNINLKNAMKDLRPSGTFLTSKTSMRASLQGVMVSIKWRSFQRAWTWWLKSRMALGGI